MATDPADITQNIVDAAAASSNPDAEVYAFGFSVDTYPDPEVFEAGTGPDGFTDAPVALPTEEPTLEEEL